ncbi:MAG: peptidoglycan-binding protein [Myxococcales bacterium]|nr:peptidoglycan-binding protein [Myxococcales bacterium]
MPVRHIVRRGDSCSSLALRHGLAPDTIWEHPDNDGLRSTRSHMDVLAEGDVIVIPDKRITPVSVATDRTHRFRRRGVPMRFTIHLYDTQGRPYASVPFVLEVDGNRCTIEGVTDGDGKIDCFLPNDSRAGELRFGEGEVRSLRLGHLEPIETVEGVQQRLSNLGFPCLGDGGEMGRATMAALMRFQRWAELDVSGVIDDATKDELRACYEDPNHLRERFERT